MRQQLSTLSFALPNPPSYRDRLPRFPDLPDVEKGQKKAGRANRGEQDANTGFEAGRGCYQHPESRQADPAPQELSNGCVRAVLAP
jgi:hypothetical protein